MIRSITEKDIPAIKNVLDNCDLFPAEYLDSMISAFFNGNPQHHLWLTYEIDTIPVAISFCAPMELTNGTYNLYAIGIHNQNQRKGIGSKLISEIENTLKQQKQRILIIETSSSDNQLGARNFYSKIGYTHEATISDFWDEGDDKLVFLKKL